jgi:putative copper export protein
MYKYIVLLHILAATVWVGGHLILVSTILPETFKKKDIKVLLNFEQKYERIGMPSLLILVISGLYLAHTLLPNFSQWFTFETHIAKHVTIKLILLLSTILLALNARFRLIPNLTIKTLPILTVHIIAVTIISMLFVATGLSLRMYII